VGSTVLDSDDEEVVQVPSPCVVGVAAAPSAKATDALNDVLLLLSVVVVVEGVVVFSPLRAVVVADTIRVDAWDAPAALSESRRTTSLMLVDEAGKVTASTSTTSLLGASDRLVSIGRCSISSIGC
jgi:hypothetical protein